MPLGKLLHRLRNWRKTRGKTATGLPVYENKNTGNRRTNKGTQVAPRRNKNLPSGYTYNFFRPNGSTRHEGGTNNRGMTFYFK